MKAQVLFDAHGHVISMLLPATGAGHVLATPPRAAFRSGHGQRSAELEIPVELRELRSLDIRVDATAAASAPWMMPFDVWADAARVRGAVPAGLRRGRFRAPRQRAEAIHELRCGADKERSPSFR